MNKINWVYLSEFIAEGFEGEDRAPVARVAATGTGPWHWQLLQDDGCPWQVKSGEELEARYAFTAAEDARNDQVARSGRGPMMRWTNPTKDSWYAFSGDANIGNVTRYGARSWLVSGHVIHRSHEFQHAVDARRFLETNWVDHLEHLNLVPKPQFKNPPTVPVVMVPVAGRGILLVRRNIQPGLGLLALPGGYHVEGETWQEAAEREVKEETGIIVSNLRIVDLKTVNGRQNLAFAECDPIVIDADHVFVHDHEVQEVIVANKPVELCFQTHTDQLEAFFERHPELRG